MKSLFAILFLLLVPLPITYAQDLLFAIEQSEYYFIVGEEDAVLPISINNSYEEQISGMLQYTVTQQISQGGMQFSSSNTNTNQFTVDKGSQGVFLNLGTSEIPSTFVLNLRFTYNDSKAVLLGPITIHFVSDESQKNNQAEPMQGTTQENTQQPTPQNPFTQQQQQMQQRVDELLEGRQRSLQQDPQQRLQNNQMSQDNTALKQQIQNQLQLQEQTQREFEDQLSSDSEFAKQHTQLTEEGYGITDKQLDPTSGDTGSFEIRYQNAEGKWASLQGQMHNGTISALDRQTQERQEQLLERLKQDSQFQEFHQGLTNENFLQSNIEFQENENQANVTIQYKDQQGANASIVGMFENDEIQQIILDNGTFKTQDLLLITLLVTIFASVIVAYVIFRKRTKKYVVQSDHMSVSVQSRSQDHISESQKLMAESQKHYDKKKYKDAFAVAGQAIRLFLSYETELKKEITNEELFSHIENYDYPVEEVRQCLEISSLVEFAKLSATEDDYEKLISLFAKLSDSKKP